MSSPRNDRSPKLSSEEREHLEYILEQWGIDVGGEVYDPVDYYYDLGEVKDKGRLKTSRLRTDSRSERSGDLGITTWTLGNTDHAASIGRNGNGSNRLGIS